MVAFTNGRFGLGLWAFTFALENGIGRTIFCGHPIFAAIRTVPVNFIPLAHFSVNPKGTLSHHPAILNPIIY